MGDAKAKDIKPGDFSPDLANLGQQLLSTGPRKTSSTTRRVRVILNNTIIVDTTEAIHVWEHDGYPQFYIPFKALSHSDKCRWTDLREVGPREDGGKSDGGGKAVIGRITVQGPDGEKAVDVDRGLRFTGVEGQDKAAVLNDTVRLDFAAMDSWLEEDDPIYVHPKDPFKRVDTLNSIRPIKISLDGKVLAESTYAVHLLETGLPTRYYIPRASVDQSLLRKSTLITKCPYKGDAEYHHVVVKGKTHENLVWYYRLPTREANSVSGLVCFYNEKVDIELDGVKLERPKTHFK